MEEQTVRTRIRGLMASGALPAHPYAGMARMETGHQGLFDEQCVACEEAGPHVLYTYRDGKALHLHAACDALWREECPPS
jgi:hypothetical protein